MKDEVPTGSIVINKDGEFVTDTTLMKGHWYDFIFNYFKEMCIRDRDSPMCPVHYR